MSCTSSTRDPVSLPWPGVKTEQVYVVVYSDELRQEVTRLPDWELAGSPRKVFRHYALRSLSSV
jgi:hypothetical protein